MEDISNLSNYRVALVAFFATTTVAAHCCWGDGSLFEGRPLRVLWCRAPSYDYCVLVRHMTLYFTKYKGTAAVYKEDNTTYV